MPGYKLIGGLAAGAAAIAVGAKLGKREYLRAAATLRTSKDPEAREKAREVVERYEAAAKASGEKRPAWMRR